MESTPSCWQLAASCIHALRKSTCTSLWMNTPIHDAARSGHSSIVELLLVRGAATEDMNERNRTAIHLAARHGHSNVVELLIEKGALIEF